MATRTALTKNTVLGAYPSLPLTTTAADLTMQAADASNGNSVKSSGNDLIIAYNSGAGAYTLTISSVADREKRTGDIATYSIAAGAISVFGPFPRQGWMQPDGNLYMMASNASIMLAVLALS